MEQSGGAIAASSPKPSPSAAAGGGGGEDCLSALPDHLLVLILLCLDTVVAVRTCALSRRWRRVWALLPKLRFHLAPDGPRIREILDAPEALSLVRISVTTKEAGPESAAAWLPAAARRLSGRLVYRNKMAAPMNDDEEAVGRGDVHLPCFEKATRIDLNMGFLGLGLPSRGIFARLTELSLMRVDFHGLCELGSAVSSPRCPLLKKLEVFNSRGLLNLSIHSETLMQIVLKNLGSLLELKIVAPTLQKLDVQHSLSQDDDDDDEIVANISAPQLVSLTWIDVYDPESVHLGNLGRLQRLNTSSYVYGLQEDNQNCLSLLQLFKVLDCLCLSLFWQRINESEYLMGDMLAMLPQIRFLRLSVFNQGHSFGGSLFHVLSICTGLRKLSLLLDSSRSLESACPSGCLCDQLTSWKTEELLLNHLEDIRILDLKGVDHEVAFLKQLFKWAIVLKKMTIAFEYQVSKSKANEFCQALAGSSRPQTSVGFYMYRDAEKRVLFLLKPEGQGTGL